jgi:tetratricopeptide (TPR) repeat protein
MAQSPANDCAGCHMPKEPLKRISHSALTDHRILARPGEPLPESAFHQTTAQLPDLVQLDAMPEPSRKPVPPLALFRAYGELMAAHPDYVTQFESILDSLAAAKNEDAGVLAALGRKKMRDLSAASQAAAADYLQRALRAGSTDAYDFEQLATLEAQGGKMQDAIATARRGIEANPYSPRLLGLLAALYISAGSYDDALKTMQKDLELFPGDDGTRSLMRRLEAAQAQRGSQIKEQH